MGRSQEEPEKTTRIDWDKISEQLSDIEDKLDENYFEINGKDEYDYYCGINHRLIELVDKLELYSEELTAKAWDI